MPLVAVPPSRTCIRAPGSRAVVPGAPRPARTGAVKTAGARVRGASTEPADGPDGGFPRTGPPGAPLPRGPGRTARTVFDLRELTMADVAFVLITLAVFALVALTAKGVAGQ